MEACAGLYNVGWRPELERELVALTDADQQKELTRTRSVHSLWGCISYTIQANLAANRANNNKTSASTASNTSNTNTTKAASSSKQGDKGDIDCDQNPHGLVMRLTAEQLTFASQLLLTGKWSLAIHSDISRVYSFKITFNKNKIISHTNTSTSTNTQISYLETNHSLSTQMIN